MRLIDADALIAEYDRVHIGKPGGARKLMVDAPTIEVSRWIPCSERLPEERQEILATTTDNAWGDVMIIRTYYKEMHKSVIAWMPLPEPYRKDGD